MDGQFVQRPAFLWERGCWWVQPALACDLWPNFSTIEGPGFGGLTSGSKRPWQSKSSNASVGGFPGQLVLHSLSLTAAGQRRLFDGVSCLVVSPAVPGDDPSVAYARQSGVPVYSLVEALQRITEGCHRVCVAGTHGKSTTTAMIWSILSETAANPCLRNRFTKRRKPLAPRQACFVVLS